jgi:hypothetical protein
MHGPTCIFWANLTPLSLKGVMGAEWLDAANAAVDMMEPPPADPPAMQSIPKGAGDGLSVTKNAPAPPDGRHGRFWSFRQVILDAVYKAA